MTTYRWHEPPCCPTCKHAHECKANNRPLYTEHPTAPTTCKEYTPTTPPLLLHSSSTTPHS